MRADIVEPVDPMVVNIQGLLGKIDRLRLPAASRLDVESILVRQVTKELDRALPWQAGHATRTTAVAILIGEALALDIATLHNLKLAALLHDIGLLMLPTRLRNGLRSLDPEPYVAIQHHPRLGANLLEPFAFLREASVLIAHHHEWWDGSGYPYGIRGKFIPLGARILAVADAFEAIHVPGAWDRSMRDRVALRVLRVASGTQFDPAVVDVLADTYSANRSGIS